jgi:transportin-1
LPLLPPLLQVLAQLERCRAFPEFDNYLAFVFASGDGLPVEVRQGAGLLLKNNLRSSFATLAPPHQAFIHEALLRALALPARPLRQTAGSCAVAAVAGGTPWPHLPAALSALLDSGDADRAEGALDALYKLWEEVPAAMEAEQPPNSGLRPSDALIPRTLVQFGAPGASTRALAVGAVTLAAAFMPPALVRDLDK